MMNDDCESDLKMENVIFVYPRPPISWGRYIRKKIDKFLDLLVARSLGSLHPPNKCASTVYVVTDLLALSTLEDLTILNGLTTLLHLPVRMSL